MTTVSRSFINYWVIIFILTIDREKKNATVCLKDRYIYTQYIAKLFIGLVLKKNILISLSKKVNKQPSLSFKKDKPNINISNSLIVKKSKVSRWSNTIN